MKFLLSDFFNLCLKIAGYIYWNFKGVRVAPSAYVSLKSTLSDCAVFGNSVILDEAVIAEKTYMTDAYIQHATIGSYCSIAPGAKIGLEEHDIENYSTHPTTYDSKSFVKSKGRVVVGNHVWLAANCIILQGVKIGDYAVIAAGAVVTKDVPPNEIWGGIPARYINTKDK